jgi:hypothetical protein
MDEQKDTIETDLDVVNFSDAEVLEEAYTPDTSSDDNARS